MHVFFSRAIVCVALLAAWAAGSRLMAVAPFAVGGDPRVNPSNFRVTTFASGLDNPYGMQRLSDGSLLVATSSGSDFFSSTGRLLRFVDANHDGVADGPGQLMASLPGSMTALEKVGSLILAISDTGDTPHITLLREQANPANPLATVGSIDFTFPANTWHTVHALATRPTPGNPASTDLFFNVGSAENYPATNPSQTASASGLMTATLNRDAVYKATFTDTGSTVSFSNVTQLATGLRNAAGILVHPGTGDLYFQDNGIDGLADGNEPLSADELNRIPAAAIGQSIPDFGFSDSYVQYRTGTVVGGDVQPLVAFQPHPNPNTGSESEGAAQITLSPKAFPGGLQRGIFVGFHGKFFGANEENPVLFYDLATGEYFDFISNNEPNIKHPNGLLSTKDSLFVADMGEFLTGNPNGAIYQIQSLVAFLGDMDGDGDVDNFDIGPFELALTDPGAFASQHPTVTGAALRGDVDGDGDFDNFDIQFFEALLTATGPDAVTAVPEPTSALLAAMGLVALVGCRRRKRR